MVAFKDVEGGDAAGGGVEPFEDAAADRRCENLFVSDGRDSVIAGDVGGAGGALTGAMPRPLPRDDGGGEEESSGDDDEVVVWASGCGDLTRAGSSLVVVT